MLNDFMTKLYVRFSERTEEGATAAEYGLLVALIAVVIIAGATALGVNILAKFQEAAAAI